MNLATILAAITYKTNWSINTGPMGNGQYVQVEFVDDDKSHTGRKWYISPHACHSEVVQTILKAVLTMEEHEARERFKYKGAAIFGPHFDVEKLVDLCGAGAVEVRDEETYTGQVWY